MKVQLSFDDGHELDMKTADLLKEYGLNATFYVNSGFIEERDMFPRHEDKHGGRLYLPELKQLAQDFDIGGHTFSHPADIKVLPLSYKVAEIEGDKLQIERWIGRKITSYCHPRGRYDSDVLGILADCGYTEARTTKVGVGCKSDDPFQLLALHCYNRKEYNGASWLDYIFHELDVYRHTGKIVRIFAHSWEIDKNNDWDNLEKLFKKASKYESV